MKNTRLFAEHLKLLTENDWNKLFDLKIEIERTDKFGEIKGGDKAIDGVFAMPYWKGSSIIDRFTEVVRDIEILPDFDWSHWTEGKEILQNQTQDFNQLDVITLCKLFTAIIRADRFNDGLLVGYFENGTILKIIMALHKIVSAQNIAGKLIE